MSITDEGEYALQLQWKLVAGYHRDRIVLWGHLIENYYPVQDCNALRTWFRCCIGEGRLGCSFGCCFEATPTNQCSTAQVQTLRIRCGLYVLRLEWIPSVVVIKECDVNESPLSGSRVTAFRNASLVIYSK